MKIVNRKNGYTLIEVLVAMVIFFAVVAAPTGFFIGAIRGQQRVLAVQELIDNVSYGMEYISRSLRMAKKELDVVSPCIALGYNFEPTRPDANNKFGGIKFKNYKGDCQEFYWDPTEKRLYEEIEGRAQNLPITSDDLEIVSFEITSQNSLGNYSDWNQDDDFQPRVVLFIHMEGTKKQTVGLQPDIKLQTTISQRDLDVTY